VISPLLSNLYLNEVDRMLERAKAASVSNGYEHLEYARWADDIVVLVDGHRRHDWLLAAARRRLQEELSKMQVEVNEEKTRIVNLATESASTSWGSASAGSPVETENGGCTAGPGRRSGRLCWRS